jgi:hypothetical protein
MDICITLFCGRETGTKSTNGRVEQDFQVADVVMLEAPHCLELDPSNQAGVTLSMPSLSERPLSDRRRGQPHWWDVGEWDGLDFNVQLCSSRQGFCSRQRAAPVRAEQSPWNHYSWLSSCLAARRQLHRKGLWPNAEESGESGWRDLISSSGTFHTDPRKDWAISYKEKIGKIYVDLSYEYAAVRGLGDRLHCLRPSALVAARAWLSVVVIRRRVDLTSDDHRG